MCQGGVWLCDRGGLAVARGGCLAVCQGDVWLCARGEVWLVLCRGGSGCVPGGGLQETESSRRFFQPSSRKVSIEDKAMKGM